MCVIDPPLGRRGEKGIAAHAHGDHIAKVLVDLFEGPVPKQQPVVGIVECEDIGQGVHGLHQAGLGGAGLRGEGGKCGLLRLLGGDQGFDDQGAKEIPLAVKARRQVHMDPIGPPLAVALLDFGLKGLARAHGGGDAGERVKVGFGRGRKGRRVLAAQHGQIVARDLFAGGVHPFHAPLGIQDDGHVAHQAGGFAEHGQRMVAAVILGHVEDAKDIAALARLRHDRGLIPTRAGSKVQRIGRGAGKAGLPRLGHGAALQGGDMGGQGLFQKHALDAPGMARQPLGFGPMAGKAAPVLVHDQNQFGHGGQNPAQPGQALVILRLALQARERGCEDWGDQGQQFRAGGGGGPKDQIGVARAGLQHLRAPIRRVAAMRDHLWPALQQRPPCA